MRISDWSSDVCSSDLGDRKSDGLDFDRVWVAAVQAPSQFHLPAFDKHLVEGFGHRVNRPGGNISVAFRAMGRVNLEGSPQLISDILAPLAVEVVAASQKRILEARF